MEPLLRLEHLSKAFTLKGNRKIWALQDVSLELFPGETLGIVGESGCGKSTLAKAIMGVYPKMEGKLSFHGQPLDLRSRKARLAFAEKAQMIFQDPYTSLNPRMKIGDIVGENFIIHQRLPAKERRQKAAALLEEVGLPAACAGRFPNEFSGGQRQRIGIARALALRPELLVCDEPISALDVSIQSQLMNLLKGLGQSLGLTYLFIAHDFSMVHFLSDRVAVMYRGRVVELAQSEKLRRSPLHPYTRMLSQAVLLPDPAQRNRVILQGGAEELPVALEQTKGCSFANRCPAVKTRCTCERPELHEIEPGHFAACFL